MSKTLKEVSNSIDAQLEGSKWFNYPNNDRSITMAVDLAHAVTGLNEEAGEVAGLLKKSVFRNKNRTIEQWLSELGDVLWYLTAVCAILGTDLDTVWEYNCHKLNERRATGVKGNESWEG